MIDCSANSSIKEDSIRNIVTKVDSLESYIREILDAKLSPKMEIRNNKNRLIVKARNSSINDYKSVKQDESVLSNNNSNDYNSYKYLDNEHEKDAEISRFEKS